MGPIRPTFPRPHAPMQAEQQWEFEVPAGFTTRPGQAVAGERAGVPTTALSPMAALTDTLARFFNARWG